MTAYQKSKADTYTADGVSLRNPCQVRIGDGTITVSYMDDEGPVVYEGNETGDGHYSLASKDTGGRATLHKIPDEDTLEGSWIENRKIGMWRIELEE
jgi:hypothetical protein